VGDGVTDPGQRLEEPQSGAAVRAFLAAGAGAGRPCEKVIETSISWVYLYQDRALKLKKPVDLGFLDFTTLPKRRWAAERELAFNRPAAPDIYRAVRTITREASGDLTIDGAGEALDVVLEMRRFDETATLAAHAERIDGALAERLGRIIARYHLAAAPGAAGGGAKGLAYVLASNAHLLRSEAAGLDAAAIERLIAATQDRFEAVRGLLDTRARNGFVRGCHGDLHLGNILLEAGEPVLFDCIEFNDALREIDVLYDIAFLLMDLAFRGARDAANRALNAWLDEAARGFGPELWTGLAALPLFQAVRATVRAHVNALENRPRVSDRYIAAALDWLAPTRPALVAVGGLSGSGKTTLARALAPRLGGAPGAVVLRSDEIRKRRWRRAPAEPLPPQAYTRAESAAVYGEMLDLAGACLRAGCWVLADAVFLDPAERSAAEAAARAAGAPFHGLWLEVPEAVMRARLEARRGDASDADAAVLSAQIRQNPGPITWLTRSGDTAAIAAEVSQTWGASPVGSRW
jgi:uncharacterized protein